MKDSHTLSAAVRIALSCGEEDRRMALTSKKLQIISILSALFFGI